jgi:hypothetical protein
MHGDLLRGKASVGGVLSYRRAPSQTDLEDKAADCSTAVVQFARRASRTYLDACREQGVYNAKEEMIDSLAKADAKLKALDAEAAKLTRLEADATAHRKLLGHETEKDRARSAEFRKGQAARLGAEAEEYRTLMETHDNQADAARTAVTKRFRAFMDAYADQDQGGPYFRALIVLMFETDVPGRDASKLIEGLMLRSADEDARAASHNDAE